MKRFWIFFQIFFFIGHRTVDCHGRLMNPTARGSRWRFNSTAPTDYDDNQGFCGGFSRQWSINSGKCGICGNDYSDSIPRSHEIGGLYGEGIIVKKYNENSEIDIGVFITANHRGYFLFDLCNLDGQFESEDCFTKYPLELKSGGFKYQIEQFLPAWFNTTVKIPKHFTCNHCVLRWTYITGNSWGVCPDQTEAIGCGPQENFRGCADIAILPTENPFSKLRHAEKLKNNNFIFNDKLNKILKKIFS